MLRSSKPLYILHYIHSFLHVFEIAVVLMHFWHINGQKSRLIGCVCLSAGPFRRGRGEGRFFGAPQATHRRGGRGPPLNNNQAWSNGKERALLIGRFRNSKPGPTADQFVEMVPIPSTLSQSQQTVGRRSQQGGPSKVQEVGYKIWRMIGGRFGCPPRTW